MPVFIPDEDCSYQIGKINQNCLQKLNCSRMYIPSASMGEYDSVPANQVKEKMCFGDMILIELSALKMRF